MTWLNVTFATVNLPWPTFREMSEIPEFACVIVTWNVYYSRLFFVKKRKGGMLNRKCIMKVYIFVKWELGIGFYVQWHLCTTWSTVQFLCYSWASRFLSFLTFLILSSICAVLTFVTVSRLKCFILETVFNIHMHHVTHKNCPLKDLLCVEWDVKRYWT